MKYVHGLGTFDFNDALVYLNLGEYISKILWDIETYIYQDKSGRYILNRNGKEEIYRFIEYDFNSTDWCLVKLAY